MNSACDSALASFAVCQHGVFSRTQVLACGGTDDVIRRRLARGTWVRRTVGVYSLRGTAPSWHSDLWVARLAGDADAVMSHRTAARLHGLATFREEVVEVTVPHATARLDDVAIVHQSRRLFDDHVSLVVGLPTTTVARTLIDLAATCHPTRLEISLDDALAAKKTALGDLCPTFDDLACRGRRGIGVMRRLLAARRPGYVAPSSRLEALFLRVLRRHGLSRPALQVEHPGAGMEGRRMDAAYPQHRIGFELDGRRWHTRERDFARDRERDIAAQLVGWQTYRFTWDDLVERPGWVCETVRMARRRVA